MVLEYNNNTNKLPPISSIIEDSSTWFSQVALIMAYHDDKISQVEIELPLKFTQWYKGVKEEGVLSLDIIENCNDIYQEMLHMGRNLIQLVQIKKRPGLMEFQDFQGVFTGFISRMRRVERDGNIVGSGLDQLTGLRSFDVANLDLKKEMERLSRQKVPFSLLMSRLDNFSESKSGQRALDVVVKSVKECMRSFDDAYYCGQGYFLLSLKHSDVSGAQALANRLKQAIDEHGADDLDITLSHCLTEPTVGDDIDVLLSNMRKDLEDHSAEADSILKFIEVSPLQRFMDSKED